MIRFTLYSLLFVGCCTLLFGCERGATENFQPTEDTLDLSNLDLSNLDLSGLNLDLDQTFDYGHGDRDKLGQLIDGFVKDLFEEGGEQISWVEMTTSANRTMLFVGDDTLTSFEKKGWTTVGSGLCLSRKCVIGRLEQAYEDAGDISPGECVDTRTERRSLGAKVCWRVVIDC